MSTNLLQLHERPEGDQPEARAITITASLVSPLEELVAMTISTCTSAETKRIYAIYLRAFLAAGRPLNREGVAAHIESLRAAGKSTGTVLGSLAAIRKLATEAQLRNLITFETLYAILQIKGGKQKKTKAGQWLTLPQVKQLLSLPDRSTQQGIRDAAVLAIYVGCGFRRREMADLTWAQYQDRDGRKCWVDVHGKGDKYRTVPVPTWAQPHVDRWRAACDPAETRFTSGLGYEGLFDLVEAYGNRMGVDLAPHDLRRTLAQLLRKSGAPLEQIQYTLGHASIETTTIYLGSKLELERGKAAVDQLELEDGDDAEA